MWGDCIGPNWMLHRDEQADAAAFRQWQRQMAVDRSRGHFFKSLYQAEVEEEADEAGRPIPRQVHNECPKHGN